MERGREGGGEGEREEERRGERRVTESTYCKSNHSNALGLLIGEILKYIYSRSYI